MLESHRSFVYPTDITACQEAEELFAEAMRTPVASNSVAVYNTLLNGLAGVCAVLQHDVG